MWTGKISVSVGRCHHLLCLTCDVWCLGGRNKGSQLPVNVLFIWSCIKHIINIYGMNMKTLLEIEQIDLPSFTFNLPSIY